MRYTHVLCLCALTAAPVSAQSAHGLRVGLSQPVAVQVSSRPTVSGAGAQPRSYWLEGTIVGGALGLLGGLQLQHELCAGSGNCTSSADHVWFAIPTLALAVIGGLIGSAIHKK